MKDWSQIQERYLRDAIPVRLGGLASDLSRIKSTAPHEANQSVVAGLLDESKHFIEWTAHETEIETAGYLAHLQIEIALWQYQLPDRWHNPKDRQRLANQAATWSEQVLQLSGLLG
ncbi:hypothetical protein [Armatimonas sp.]|uniref:hypothetical protein n=1 Tax=Armatimonas sp. TaxID=1872638 RepID=UPI0037524364